MYEVITLSYSNPRRQMDDDVSNALSSTWITFTVFVPIKSFWQLLLLFDQFAQNVNAFSPLMRQLARFLLTNQQGGPLAQMTITPALPSEFKTLCSIVIHSVAIFGCNSTYGILLPFVQMLYDPAALNVGWLLELRFCNFITCLFSIHICQLWQKITCRKLGELWEVLFMVRVSLYCQDIAIAWLFFFFLPFSLFFFPYPACPRGHAYFVGEVSLLLTEEFRPLAN